MSKEIIIKSPIKILTERSNCTQLNDGEIGIYQPPYRNYNGDFKCKKVQIYTKINGEILKTNSYKPTNLIHHKEMPMHPFPYEVYYTHAIVKRFFLSEAAITGKFFFETPRFHCTLLEELVPMPYQPGGVVSFIKNNAYIRGCFGEGIFFLRDLHTEANKNGISFTIPESISNVEYFQLVIPLTSIGIRGGDKSIKNNYYTLTKTEYGFRITKIPKPIDKVPTMRGIKKIYFRKKRKLYVNPYNKDRVIFKKLTGEKYYRYAAEPNFNPQHPKRFGKYCTYFCRSTHGRHKKISSLPHEYFVVRKTCNSLPNQTV